MPRKLPYRKYFRKKGYSKRLIKNLSTFKKSNQSQIYKLHAVCWQPIGNTTEVVQSLRSSYMLNYPGFYLGNGGSYGAIDNIPPILSKAMLFFHEYKVVSMKVRFEPNVVDTVASPIDVPNTVYMNPDYTEYQLLTDSRALNAGLTPKCYSDGKTVSRTMKNHTNARKAWIRTPDVSTDPTTVVLSAETPVANSFGSVRCLWSQVNTTTNIGRMYIEYNIIFRGVAQDNTI